MAIPTYNDILPGAQVVEDLADFVGTVSAAAPALVIPWSFFSAQGMDNIASLDNVEGALSSIIKGAAPWYRADSTEEPNIEFDPPRPTIITRDNENKLAWQYGVTLYQDFTVVDPDPDLIATS